MAMALRQFTTKPCRNVLTAFMSRNIEDLASKKRSLPITRFTPRITPFLVPTVKTESMIMNCNSNFPKLFATADGNSNRQIIDPAVNSFIKEIYAPSIPANTSKVYEDIPSTKELMDPLTNKLEIIEAPMPGKPLKKEAVRMILIRRRKMRKHKLRKLRKRMKFVFAKMKLKRELRKERAFRSELLTQIEEVEKFDAHEYVHGIIHKLRHYPKPETIEERRERIRLLRKKNLSNTVFVKPRFD